MGMGNAAYMCEKLDSIMKMYKDTQNELRDYKIHNGERLNDLDDKLNSERGKANPTSTQNGAEVPNHEQISSNIDTNIDRDDNTPHRSSDDRGRLTPNSERDDLILDMRDRRGRLTPNFERVRRLTGRAYTGYLPQQIDELALQAFLEGLPNKQNFRIQMKAIPFQSLQEAISYAANLDQILRNERQGSHVRSISVDSDDDETEDSSEIDILRKAHEYVGKQVQKAEKRHKWEKNRLGKPKYGNDNKDRKNNRGS